MRPPEANGPFDGEARTPAEGGPETEGVDTFTDAWFTTSVAEEELKFVLRCAAPSGN